MIRLKGREDEYLVENVCFHFFSCTILIALLRSVFKISLPTCKGENVFLSSLFWMQYLAASLIASTVVLQFH